MDTSALAKIAVSVGVTFAVYKFSHNPAIKAAALGVMGVMVARQLPYVNAGLV